MKRCPQCEFIYENEQGLCDMDGRELVYDQTALLVPENVSLLVRSSRSGRGARWKPRRMQRAALPTGVFALGASLFFVNQALTRQTPPTPHDAARISQVARAPAEVAALPTPAPNPSTAPRDETDDASAAPSHSNAQTPTTGARANGRAPARPAPTNARTAATLQREELKSKPETESAKKGSKLGSILRKTGRVLKKPFGF